jgi:hypothetical protein
MRKRWFEIIDIPHPVNFRNEQAMLFTYHDPSPETTKQALKRRLLRGFTDYQI